MKKHLAHFAAWAQNEKNERLLVILLPLAALALCALILAPQLTVYRANRAAALDRLSRQAAQSEQTSSASGERLTLSASSAGEDMYISVCGENGSVVTGVRFRLSLVSPEGEEIVCATYDDGSCYLVELVPGSYTVSMEDTAGYITAEPIIVTVPTLTHEAPSLTALSAGLNRVDGKLYYRTAEGRTASALGVDISCFNTRVDWNALREEGIDFALLRVGGRGWGSGHVYIDLRFRDYFAAAKAAGLNLGVYFYSTATTPAEAVEEAEFVVNTLAGAPLDMPIYFDTEYSGDYPHGRADRLTRAERERVIYAFCATVRQRGYEAGVYSGVYFIEHELDRAALPTRSLWIANYTKNHVEPKVDYSYDLWQYTESGRVRGVSGTVDINVIF